MATKLSSSIFFLVAAAALLAGGDAAKPSHLSVPFNRSLFPADFIFGSGSSAYQYEGAANIDGKGPNIWDTFVREHPEKIADQSTGDVAQDFYHRYKDDIKLMKKIGFDSFRFSISWARLLPKGKVSGGLNPAGVKFYNSLIDELLANGIKPFVTLFHWDLPQALEDEYGGFLSPKIIDDFENYANLCFKLFGDRVKHWVTVNEPWIFTVFGYDNGTAAPGRCSSYVGNCTAGNSATEPYLVLHHMLLSHAAAAKLYIQKYQARQKGEIGITLITHFIIPKTRSVADKKAAERMLDFFFGWQAHPITYGDYPAIIRSTVGDRLPKFTEDQRKMLIGSYDFIGLNYYTTQYASNSPSNSNNVNQSFFGDTQVILSTEKNGVAIGTPTVLPWLYVYPKGLFDLLIYIKEKYKNPPIYITENGVAEVNNATLPIKDALKDGLRIQYHYSHLSYLLKAMMKGVNVKGYYLWTFLDDFEWSSGYTIRFGLVFIDFKNNLKRYLKHSSYWFKKFLLH